MKREKDQESVFPAQSRERIVDTLPALLANDLSPRSRRNIRWQGTPVRIALRLTGHGEAVSPLNPAELQRMSDLGEIVISDEEWEKLDPVSQVDVRQEVSDLMYRRALNP